MKQKNGIKRPATQLVRQTVGRPAMNNLATIKSSCGLPPKVRTDILDYIRENNPGYTLEHAEQKLEASTDHELFRMYCVWNGLMGSWSEQLITSLDAIREYVRGA